MARGPLRSVLDDPERFNLASNQSTLQFEFSAWLGIGLRDGEHHLVVRRAALWQETSIPLKSIFVWLAGIHEESVSPGGQELRYAIASGYMGLDDEEVQGNLRGAVLKHLQLLREALLKEASSRSLQILTLVLSYPNYLCEQASEPDLNKRYYNLDKYRAF